MAIDDDYLLRRIAEEHEAARGAASESARSAHLAFIAAYRARLGGTVPSPADDDRHHDGAG